MKFNYSTRTEGLDGTATREIFKLLSRPEIISFAGGLPANEYLPIAQVDEITHEIMTSPSAGKVLQYGTTEGYPYLRELLLDYVKGVGIEDMGLDNSLVISGGQQGIDLMCKAFLNKGDVVLVEDPTYLAVLQILKSYEAKAVGVNATENGLDIDDLEAKIKKYSPKMLYVVPTFSNPTGKTYSVENRKKIAALTAKYGIPVLEDDPYSKLRFKGEPVPALKSFDKDGNIVYVTSFSKVISPGLRTGVAIGCAEIIRKLAILKQGTDLHTANLSQEVLYRYLKKGYLYPNIEKSLPLYRVRRDAMMAGIKKYMPEEFEHTDPEGGLFVWGKLSVDLDTKALLPEAVSRDVAYIQGSEFYANPADGKSAIRLNFSNESEDRIDKGLKALSELLKEKIAEVKNKNG